MDDAPSLLADCSVGVGVDSDDVDVAASGTAPESVVGADSAAREVVSDGFDSEFACDSWLLLESSAMWREVIVIGPSRAYLVRDPILRLIRCLDWKEILKSQ